MNKDKTLYNIISGRTKLDLDGLILYVLEPSPLTINKSYEIYEEVYEKSYMDGVYINEELKEVLVTHELWFPFQEQSIEDVRKKIEDKKVEAYENYFKKELIWIKRALRGLNNELLSLLSKKHIFDNLTCHYAAEMARVQWILSKTTYYNKKLIKDGDFDIHSISSLYFSKALSSDQVRNIARHDLWRAIWNANKIHGGKLFDRNPINFTRDQLSLCSYSCMYDNVFEHPESPHEKVIEDNDCLDGWFIFQKRKRDKDKNSQQTEELIKNPKIKNSREVFVMANTPEEIKHIQDLNDQHTKNILKQRAEVINEKGRAKDTDFIDVQNELMMQENQLVRDKVRGK